jgi:hypothetical protein
MAQVMYLLLALYVASQSILINRSYDPRGNTLRVAWVGNSPIVNWHADMTFATFLLVPVANYTNHGLACLCGCNLHLSTTLGAI